MKSDLFKNARNVYRQAEAERNRIERMAELERQQKREKRSEEIRGIIAKSALNWENEAKTYTATEVVLVEPESLYEGNEDFRVIVEELEEYGVPKENIRKEEAWGRKYKVFVSFV